jgi:hypothetical protein
VVRCGMYICAGGNDGAVCSVLNYYGSYARSPLLFLPYNCSLAALAVKEALGCTNNADCSDNGRFLLGRGGSIQKVFYLDWSMQ